MALLLDKEATSNQMIAAKSGRNVGKFLLCFTKYKSDLQKWWLMSWLGSCETFLNCLLGLSAFKQASRELDMRGWSKRAQVQLPRSRPINYKYSLVKFGAPIIIIICSNNGCYQFHIPIRCCVFFLVTPWYCAARLGWQCLVVLTDEARWPVIIGNYTQSVYP